MRTAPPVQVQCTGGRVWRLVQVLLPAAAATSFFAWVLLRLQGPVWACVFFGVVAALLSWARLPSVPVHLAWDGQVWTADGVSGDLRLMLHVGPWLLLRHHPAATAARWLAVDRGDTGADHHAFCAAVYCLRSEPTPGGSPRQP